MGAYKGSGRRQAGGRQDGNWHPANRGHRTEDEGRDRSDQRTEGVADAGRLHQGLSTAQRHVLQLQRSVGNQAVAQLYAGSGMVVQRQCDRCGNTMCQHGSLCGGRSRKYAPGDHGFKTSEQKRLSQSYGFRVTGDTHESEHAVGFEPLNQTSGLKRGTPGRARNLEYKAPAYQEVKELHRGHIGTGTRGTPDHSGFTSDGYRDTQRSFLESGDVSTAIQINQLGYAQDPHFASLSQTAEGKAASDSYEVMVGGMTNFTYASGSQDTTVPVSRLQQAEMLAARRMAELQRQLRPEEIAEIYQMLGMDDYWSS